MICARFRCDYLWDVHDLVYYMSQPIDLYDLDQARSWMRSALYRLPVTRWTNFHNGFRLSRQRGEGSEVIANAQTRAMHMRLTVL